MKDWRYNLSKLREAVPRTIAWWLPKKVVMWAAIRVGAHATTGPYREQVVPELRFMDAVDRWDKR